MSLIFAWLIKKFIGLFFSLVLGVEKAGKIQISKELALFCTLPALCQTS